eukprot:787874-Lingulodinium_polyedra.AAC.1
MARGHTDAFSVRRQEGESILAKGKEEKQAVPLRAERFLRRPHLFYRRAPVLRGEHRRRGRQVLEVGVGSHHHVGRR